MKTKFTTLLLFWVLAISAQTTITGTLQDKQSREAVSFANVVLCNKGDSVPLVGVMSDIDGQFALTTVEKGELEIRISFLGYQPVVKKVNIQGSDIRLGKILLQEDSRTLNEVEIVSQGSDMRFELDKKVFSVDQSIASAGGSVTDVLENVPSVEVDQEGNISLRNSDAVEIWINGKPSGLSAETRAQVLEQLPAASIKEIEVITNPSAKFSPEGTAGIINLVLKKDRQKGYYGSVTAGISYPWGGKPGGNAGANFNYSEGIVDFSFNLGYRYRSSHGKTITDRRVLQGLDTLTQLKQDATSDRQGGGIFARATLDIRLTDRSTLGFSGFALMGDKNHSENNSRYTLTDWKTSDVLRDYRRIEQGKTKHPGGNAQIYYQLKLKQHSLDLSAAYNNFQFNQDNTYIQEESDTTRQEQLNHNNDHFVRLKADYEWKPTQQSRLEAGWQTDLAWRRTDADAWDLPTLQRQPLDAYYNDFLNREQIHALYITYGNRFWDRFSVQVGLRGEYMKRHLRTEYFTEEGTRTVAERDTSYFQLFPSVYLSYSFPNNHELQLNYTRRVDRPRGHQINPRQNFSDSTNIQYGNPGLLPAYSSALELNYLKTWDRHTLSAGLFYRFSDGVIQNVRYMDGDVMKNTFINMSKRNDLGVEVVAKNRLFKEVLMLTTSVNVYYNTLKAAHYHNTLNGSEVDIDLAGQKTFVWSVRLNAQFMFTKTFTGQLSGRYSSPRVVAQGRTSHNYTIDLGLRKTFLNKKIALSLNVRDLLNSRARSNTTYTDNFWQYQKRKWNSTTISLTFTYSFGNMNNKKKPQKGNDSDGGASYEDSGEE